MFISNNPIDEIRQFITDNKLENSGYFFLNDRNYQLARNYDIPTVPFMLLYIDNKLYVSVYNTIKYIPVIDTFEILNDNIDSDIKELSGGQGYVSGASRYGATELDQCDFKSAICD